MNTARIQHEFLQRLGDLRPFKQLLDLLPDVAVFLKDRRGCFMLNNRRAVECCGVGSEAETIGKTDRDFFRDDRHPMYRAQDQQVMRTGRPIINALCPAPELGSDALIVYSKVPLRDRRGHIIGVAGFHREVRGLRAPPASFGRLSRAVNLMHEHHAETLHVTELARRAGLSRSQFNRQFRRLFGVTPREYLLRVRVHAACHLLEETDRKATAIAQETGFFDHSHFSRTFSRIMGSSPRVYRQRHTTG
jgi:AraC-like DNA-binding protein